MKLVRTLTFAGLGAGSLAALVLMSQGCGSTAANGPEDSGTGSSSSKSSSKSSSSGSTSATSSGSNSGSASSTAVGGGTPPPASGPATTSTTKHNFAIHHLYVGDDTPTPSYTPSSTAWKTIGYNIDGLDTTASSTNVCTPYTHGQTAQQIDGANGIDNAFGSQIVPQLSAIGNLSSTVSLKIIGGSFSILIDTTGLTDSTTPAQTNTALGGELFAGSTYTGGGAPPLTGTSFSLTDNWPVSSALLTDGMTIAGGSKINFPAAYVTNNVWVSGAPVNLGLSLSLEGETLTLTIHSAVISFTRTVDSAGQNHATNGIISGVLETTEFISAINQVVGQISGGAECSLVSAIEPLIYNAQDIIIDSTTGAVSNTAGTPCNGVSIGLAFDADEIAQPSVVAPNVDAGTALPPCGSSGTGSSSATTSHSSTSGSGSSESSGSAGSSTSTAGH